MSFLDWDLSLAKFHQHHHPVQSSYSPSEVDWILSISKPFSPYFNTSTLHASKKNPIEQPFKHQGKKPNIGIFNETILVKQLEAPKSSIIIYIYIYI